MNNPPIDPKELTELVEDALAKKGKQVAWVHAKLIIETLHELGFVVVGENA